MKVNINIIWEGDINMFEAFAKKRFIIGAKQVKNAITAETASKVYIASDSDSVVIDPVVRLAESYEIPVFYISTRKELGEMCGIDVKASCAAEPV